MALCPLLFLVILHSAAKLLYIYILTRDDDDDDDDEHISVLLCESDVKTVFIHHRVVVFV